MRKATVGRELEEGDTQDLGLGVETRYKLFVYTVSPSNHLITLRPVTSFKIVYNYEFRR